jgi:CelD/BcsL family acetyltransferase involved in cellulose biosynthesis
VRVEITSLCNLSDVLAERWRDLQKLTPEFMSPLLGPDFALLVSRHRPNAKLAIGYLHGQAVAFFAFHPTRSGYVRAIGAPFCDYQAIVSDPALKLSGPQFLESAGISSIFCASLSDPNGLFELESMTRVEAYRINCGDDGQAHMESLRVANPKWAKNLRRLSNKMDRELGPIRLVGFDTSQDSYDALMQIKIAQFYETGVTNVLRPKWAKAFMQDLFDMRQGDFSGCLLSLYAGDKFVAGQFGVRLGDWFHPWIASTCPLSHAFSPGIIFLSETIKNADTIGIRTVDLSGGHSHYKAQFCRDPYIAYSGIIGERPQTAPSQANGALALINRRLDLISAVEPDLGGRLIAIGSAVASVPRRIIARRNAASRS